MCWDRALVLWKKNLQGRGLTKVEKHWSAEFTHAVQLNCFFLSNGLYTILQFFYWVGKLFKWRADVSSSLWTAGTQEPLAQKGKGKGVRRRLLVFWYGMQVDAWWLSASRLDESQEMSTELQCEFRHQAGQTALSMVE